MAMITFGLALVDGYLFFKCCKLAKQIGEYEL